MLSMCVVKRGEKSKRSELGRDMKEGARSQNLVGHVRSVNFYSKSSGNPKKG